MRVCVAAVICSCDSVALARKIVLVPGTLLPDVSHKELLHAAPQVYLGVTVPLWQPTPVHYGALGEVLPGLLWGQERGGREYS